MIRTTYNTWLTCTATCIGAIGYGLTAAGQTLDFDRDVRPILSDNCYACHGFDENARQADLRLDTFSGATADLGGYAAIVPGQPDQSELIRRIAADDQDELMPPADSHRPALSADAVQLLSEWIRQGAVWGEHWSFIKPVKLPVPPGISPIDYFVEQRLASKNLNPAPSAEPHTLVRRLAFDLLGLPPTTAQIKRFSAAPTDDQWRRLVDELMASPHFGERMAMWWLDAARYSDTDGFQQDATRTNWPWRDWVVSAFNRNMPFDQFTIEQFAGDLLPSATDEQILATCFHRNHMNNGEGGRDPEESRVDYVLDRVNTAGTLWLGLTLGCTQCHDHKFDPVSQRDYYSLSAYFNSIDETGAAGSKAGPFITWTSPVARQDVAENEQLLRRVEQEIASERTAAEEPFVTWLVEQVLAARNGFQAWKPVNIVDLKTTEGYPLNSADGNVIFSGPHDLPQDDYIVSCSPPKIDRITAVRLDVLPHAAHTDGKLAFSDSGEFILTNFKLRVRTAGSSQYREIELANAISDVDGKGQDEKYAGIVGTLDDDPRTGWTTRTYPADVPHWAVYELAEPLVLAADEQLDIILMQRSLANRELIGRFKLSVSDQRGTAVRSKQPMPLERLAAELSNEREISVRYLLRGTRPSGALHKRYRTLFSPPILKKNPQLKLEQLGHDLRIALFEQYLEDNTTLQLLRKRQDAIQRQLNDAQQAAGELQVAVLKDRDEPRQTFVLERGVWDNPGEEVAPGVLPALLASEDSKYPTRLELGQWIVSADNPLTARVIVNQVWQLCFGAGLVRTPEDFGRQGELPTHPQLLDWLAVDFMDSGWDLKHLVRTIVTSHTYRQSSSVDPESLELDPENRLLARGARFRLPAWMIRDARLAVSGLLNRRLGGPPVFPYQPEGVWKDQFMGRFEYHPTIGPGQYRRTIYAFWRRSSAPTFLFDAAMRRTCEVAQRRTNTPLHALTLMNDLTGQEAARNLADMLLPAAAKPAQPLATSLSALWQRVLGRQPDAEELSLLAEQYEQAWNYYSNHPDHAREFLAVGQLSMPGSEQLAKRAAMMVAASLLFNLDECITHE